MTALRDRIAKRIAKRLERRPVTTMAFQASILISAVEHVMAIESNRVVEPSEGIIGDALRKFRAFRAFAAKRRANALMGRWLAEEFACREQYAYALVEQVTQLVHERRWANDRSRRDRRAARVVDIASRR